MRIWYDAAYFSAPFNGLIASMAVRDRKTKSENSLSLGAN
jgi:hypothetical protein